MIDLCTEVSVTVAFGQAAVGTTVHSTVQNFGERLHSQGYDSFA